MKVKLLLFPHYVSLISASSLSPRLFQFLESQSVELEIVRWNGELGSLDVGEMSIVRASTMLGYDWATLSDVCRRYGHFVFYGDAAILPDGRSDPSGLIPAVKKFLIMVR